MDAFFDVNFMADSLHDLGAEGVDLLHDAIDALASNGK
jgi:hypothetical protein